MHTTLETHAPPATMEAVPCELCGSDERTLIVERSDLLLGGDETYTLHECGGCGVLYLHPRPTPAAMGRHYPPDYQPYKPAVQSEPPLFRVMRRYGLWKRCRVITQYVPQGRLLDVGCATGDFLTEMRQQPGWQVYGIEPGYSAARRAHDESRLDVLCGVLTTAPFPAASFDAITFWDVLEHVYDPYTVLHEAARLLRPGGVLVVNHPNLNSLDRWLFGANWLGYELPRHLYLFPPAVLRATLAPLGLYEVEQRCLYGSYSALVSSLVFTLNRRLGVGGVGRLVERVLLSMPLRILAAPFTGVQDRLLRGCNVTVVFRKRPA